MFMTTLIIIALILAALVVVIHMQPAQFTVQRSLPMAVSPDKAFVQVNNLQAWNAWSPWAKLDPNAKTTFEGPSAGEGAVMRWTSDNMNVGQGSMAITESRPNELVKLKLDFLKPMKGTNTGEFQFKPEGTQTLVTWGMIGHKNFMGKAMGLFMSCEKMVGGQFEKGLMSLKQIVETAK
jgi:hypothetical protein